MASMLSHGAYRRARHLDVLSDALVDLAMGDITRLMVLMPPRHGKSETCSHWFPAWLYSLWPDTKVILGSYGFDLARDAGLRVRGTLVEHEILGVSLAKGSRAARIWKTSEGGTFFAAGVGSGVTGRGADFLILDDIVKGTGEASSPRSQERNWSWWQSDFRTRRNERGRGGRKGGILAIGTRWNENDLLGKLIQAYKSGPTSVGYEPWTILCLPCEAEENDLLGRAVGEPLWEEGGYGREFIETTKSSRGSYVWAALFQQRPAPQEGNIVKAKWFQRYEDAPDTVDEIAMSWDMTFKKAGTSFVVGQVWGRVGADFYLLDQARGKWDFVETLAAFRALVVKWPEAAAKYVEDKANGSAVIAALHNEIPGLIPVEPEGGKDARLFAVSSLIEAGNVYLPAHEAWADDVIYETVAFPNAANDDMVDCMTQALTRMRIRALHQEEVTLDAISDRASMRRPLDSFGYNANDGDDDDDDAPRASRHRSSFGYTPR